MRDDVTKALADRFDVHEWQTRDMVNVFMVMQDHDIDYTLDAHDGEHRARIYYRDKHGTRVQTEAKDRDAFTALRDALYQWVRATEEEV